MSYPLLQFVDSPSATATLRYDFNSTFPSYRTLPLGGDGLDLGTPSFTGEPEGVGVDYGYRQIRLTQRIISSSKATALGRLSALSKELLRPYNWLRYQPDAVTSPVYFRTYRGEPGSLSLEWSEVAGAWDVTVPLPAEGFAYGARVAMSTFQVIQSPADLTGPTRTAMRVVLPAVRGDAPTNLRITITPAGTSGSGPNASWLVGCICGKATMADTVVDIGTGDGLTAGTGTGAGATDAAFFNGSYRAVTVGAGANFLARLSGSMPAVPAGRYKVLLRYEADSNTTAAKPYIFAFGTASTSSFAVTYGTAATLTVPQSNPTTIVYRGWIDLGDFTLPADVSVPRDTTDTLPAPNLAPYFSVKIGTSDSTAGAGLRIDAIKLIPIAGPTVDSARNLKLVWPRNPPQSGGGTALVGTFDGDSEASWLTLTGTLYPTNPSLVGAFPIADPASAQNLLVLMALNHGDFFTAATATTTTKDAQVAVDVSYHPRYLHVGDGT